MSDSDMTWWGVAALSLIIAMAAGVALIGEDSTGDGPQMTMEFTEVEFPGDTPEEFCDWFGYWTGHTVGADADSDHLFELHCTFEGHMWYTYRYPDDFGIHEEDDSSE